MIKFSKTGCKAAAAAALSMSLPTLSSGLDAKR